MKPVSGMICETSYSARFHLVGHCTKYHLEIGFTMVLFWKSTCSGVFPLWMVSHSDCCKTILQEWIDFGVFSF